MIRGYRRRYVLIRDLLLRDDLLEAIEEGFRDLFGLIGLQEARLKFFVSNRRGTYAIRVTLERLDELLTVLAILRGIVVERVSGSIKKLRDLGLDLQEVRRRTESRIHTTS